MCIYLLLKFLEVWICLRSTGCGTRVLGVYTWIHSCSERMIQFEICMKKMNVKMPLNLQFSAGIYDNFGGWYSTKLYFCSCHSVWFPIFFFIYIFMCSACVWRTPPKSEVLLGVGVWIYGPPQTYVNQTLNTTGDMTIINIEIFFFIRDCSILCISDGKLTDGKLRNMKRQPVGSN